MRAVNRVSFGLLARSPARPATAVALALALGGLAPAPAFAQDSGGAGRTTVKPAGPAPVVTSVPVNKISTAKKVSTAVNPVEPVKPVKPLPLPATKAPVIKPAAARKTTTTSPASPAPVASVSPADLRRFEERAFPRDPVRRVPPPALEGSRGARRPVRTSAANPPPTLRSRDQAEHRRARQARPEAPPSWIAGLSLPDLPVTWDRKLIRYLEFYRHHPRGQALMRYWLRRKGRHEAMIVRELRRQGIPESLAYVAMIESSYDPTLTSRVGAAGLWQFMVHSGRAYGLRRDYWIDERRNPARSTASAARHLKELHRRFGTWELALAAYNAGPGMVIAAMRKYNTNDYWQLCRYEAGLPWSTSLYVPKILAAAIVGRNRERFGFGKLVADPPFERSYELVAVSRSTSLATIARAAGVAKAVVVGLNPELRRGRTPPRAKVWVRVPRGSGTRFYGQLARIQRAPYRPYVVRLGDSEESLARQLGVGRFQLRKINGMRRGAELRPGLTILVPARARLGVTAAPAAATAADPQAEAVVVALPESSPSRVAGRQRVFYRVVLGDTLTEIATHLRVTAAELAGWNGLKIEARLVSNMVLQAFVKPGFDRSRVRLLDRSRVRLMVAGSEAFLDQHELAKGRKRVVYHARKGDTLRGLARRFGLTIGSLMRINRFARSTRLGPGQKVVVYVEQRRALARRGRAAKRKNQRAKRKTQMAKRKTQMAKQETQVAKQETQAAKRPRALARRTKPRVQPAVKVKVPVPRPPGKVSAPAAPRRLYRVRPGDTLSGIALRFGLSVKRLMRLNRLARATDLRAGQRLKVAAPAGAGL